MKPYGMTKVEYINDSKKVGDMKGTKARGRETRRSCNRLGQKTALRRYKKVARRTSKSLITDQLKDCT